MYRSRQRLAAIAVLIAGVSVAGTSGHSVAGDAPLVHVSDVDELYEAVNDPANAQTNIQLDAGTYVLRPFDADGIARPNGGRLEMQRGMSLSGVHGSAEDVVIDASSSDAPAFPIRVGRSSEAIRWLTVVGRPTTQAAIVTDLTGDPVVWIRIDHVIVSGAQRGIDVRNAGSGAAGRTVLFELADSELTGNRFGNGQGLRLVNSGADAASIVASLRRNRSRDNLAGVLIANLASNGASIVIDSRDDRFEANRIGCVVFGGITLNPADRADDNRVELTMHAGAFTKNAAGLYPPNSFAGGLAVVGGHTSPGGSTSRNEVSLSLWGTRLDGHVADVSAWGANTNGSGLSGTNNRVTVELHGVSSQAVTQVVQSNPPETVETNSVTVVK